MSAVIRILINIYAVVSVGSVNDMHSDEKDDVAAIQRTIATHNMTSHASEANEQSGSVGCRGEMHNCNVGTCCDNAMCFQKPGRSSMGHRCVQEGGCYCHRSNGGVDGGGGFWAVMMDAFWLQTDAQTGSDDGAWRCVTAQANCQFVEASYTDLPATCKNMGVHR